MLNVNHNYVSEKNRLRWYLPPKHASCTRSYIGRRTTKKAYTVWQPPSSGDFDVPLWSKAGTEVQTYIVDGNKNVRQLKNAAGVIITNYDYDPFGNVTATGSVTPWQFSSEYHDAKTGLVYYNYCHYAPTIGRWINRGPIAEQGGANLCMMNNNSPMNKIDYQGLADLPKPESQCECDGSLIRLIFNGRTLSSSDGQFVSVAISGLPVDKKIISYEKVNHLSFTTIITTYEKLFSYSTEASKKKGAGPIPKGLYWFNVDETNSANNRPRHLFAQKPWGKFSWSLHPEQTTETFGRSGFFIHGGTEYGSAGCIDITNKDSDLAKYLKGLWQLLR